MSLSTPTTREISDNILAQLESSLNQTIPLLPKSFLRVLTKALAAVFVLLYKYAGFTFLQLFVRTATYAETEVNGATIRPLVEWGRLIGVGDPTAATQAELVVNVTVETQGGVLAAGAQLFSAGGAVYVTLSGVSLNASTVRAIVRAVEPGTDGNLAAGDVLTFANPLADVARETVVTSQTVTAADAEATEVYRQRVLDRFQKRPQGGAYADYEQWGETVEGIVNVYPYTGYPGEVDVYAEATVASSGSADGIPTTAQLQAVLDAINLDDGDRATRRNANAFVNAYPITRTGFDVTVSGIALVDDLGQVQTDITAALDGYFRSAEPFILGLSIPPRLDYLTQTRIAALVEDVVTAAGGTFSAASFRLAGPSAARNTYVLGEGEKAKLSTVYFS